MSGAVLVAVAAAVGNLLQGWDNATIAGAVLYIKREFKLESEPTVEGLIVAMSLIGATLITTFSGAIADWLGRRPLLIISSVLYFISGLVMLWSPNVYVLLLARLLDGFGIGLSVTLVPVYISETAPPEIRGLLNTLPQFSGSGGMFMSYCMVFGMSLMQSPSWRLMLGVLSVPSLVYFALTVFFLPESPRWLVSKGRMLEAKQVLQRLRGREDVSGEMALLVEGLGVGAETSIEEYIIGPDNEIIDDDQDLSGEKDQIKLYGPEEGLSWIARPVTRQSTVGLVSRHGSMASRSGLVDPLVTLFGSVHEKLPEAGSMRSMLFPHFGSMFSVGGGNQPRQEEWDEESLAREGEEYVSDAAAGDSDDNLHSPLISRQTTSLEKELGPPPHGSLSSMRHGSTTQEPVSSMGIGGGWQLAWKWSEREGKDGKKEGGFKRIYLHQESVPGSVRGSLVSIPGVDATPDGEVIQAAALVSQPALYSEDLMKQHTVGPAMVHPSEVAAKGPSWGDLFEPGVKHALAVGVGLQILQQFSGINGVLYYTPQILDQAGVGVLLSNLGLSSSSASLLISAMTTLLMLPAIAVAMRLMDVSGRRTLLLTTIPILILSLVILVLGSLVDMGSVVNASISTVSVILYFCFFVMGFGPVPNILCAEIFPTRVRGLCIAICALTFWIGDIIVTYTLPVLLKSIGLAGVFGLYAIVCLISWVFVFMKVPGYTALKQKSIITFRDDEKLEQGKYISPELLKAIEESKYAIIVLSTNYASSRWCLIELAKIVECMKKTRLTVLPVFYHVDPSDVRNRRGTLAEAFAKHEKDIKVNTKDVQEWKAALRDVGHIAGWHVHDRYESKVIQEIIGRICTELYHKFSSVCEDLVGMDSCVEEMLGSYLGEGLGDVHFVGICGIGGMGKTTLAQEIYRRISGNFEVGKFIANVREETKNHGLVSLQKQLLSKTLMESEINISNVYEGINVIRNTLCDKKVFIVLDDVDGEKQLEALAGKHDWFGAGSIIILTSRDSHFLQRNGVDDVYKIKGLNDDEALKLFSLKAFHKPHPEENFVNLSMVFVNYAKGLPLALKVLGSLLFDKTKNEWKSALNKLKAEFDENIMNILQISFDGLMDTQKALFLDIACFFKGENKDCIRDVLQSFGYCPDYNIGVLIDKSLITIEGHGILWMHDLLQDMGQEIVRRESPGEPGGRSRLWIYKDVIRVLKNNTGTEAVEGIMLKVPIQKMEHLHAEAFSKMKNLRILKIDNKKFPQDFINGTMQLPKSLNYLSDELRIVEWHGYPFKSMPTSFQPNKLVELRMRWSCLEHLWKGIMDLNELRLIDLSDSQNLIEMPDLSGAPKLKQLILQRCIRLSEIHASLGNLKWLTRLDLNGCKCLSSLPNVRCLMSLKILTLSGCSKINKLPEDLGNIEGLKVLDASETAITELPSSFVLLKNLRVLSLRRCEGLSCTSSNKLISFFPLMKKRRVDPTGMLGRSLSNLWSLTYLDLSYCNLQAIPDSLGCLSSLNQFESKLLQSSGTP